jgi:hypothetical protein
LLVLASLVLIAATVLAPAASAKGKKAACRGTKVAVTIGKKKSCQAFAKVFPQPQAIDTRLAYIQQVLKFDPANAVTGKKRKRFRKLQSGFRAASKRAQKKLLKIAPKALAFVDRHAGAARSSSFPPAPALVSSGCHPGPAGPTGGFEGASMGMLGDNGGYMDVPIGGGLHAKVTFVSCGGVTAFNIPECPTANGTVDGKGRGEFSVTFEVRSSSRVYSRNTSNFEQKAKIHGEVGPDAKLKFIDVEHTEELFIVASAEGYPVVIRGGVTRKVHIPMPAANYDPASASAHFFGDPLKPDTGAESFANTAKSAITSYKSAEERWSSFQQPYCAEPAFNPDSNAIKLKAGDAKQLAMYAKARADGGRATEARWTLLGPLNADFSPASSEAASPTIQYTVAKPPVGDQVRVTAKVTSTAGVGQKTWMQPIESSGFKVEGTFGGEESAETAVEVPSVEKWTGAVKFNGSLPAQGGGGPSGIHSVESGNVSIDISGIESSSITGCHQSGSAQGPLGGGSMTVTGTGPEDASPYEDEIQLAMPFMPIHATRVAPCPKAAQEEGYEGTEFDAVPYWRLQVSGKESADGRTFVGSAEETFGIPPFVTTFKEFWTLHATE